MGGRRGGASRIFTAGHRAPDIKADSVLVDQGGVAKLCDFSFSALQAFGQEQATACTPGYYDEDSALGAASTSSASVSSCGACDGPAAGELRRC